MFDADIRTEMGHERHQRFIEAAQEKRCFRQLHRHNSTVWLPLIKFIGQLLAQTRSQWLRTISATMR